MCIWMSQERRGGWLGKGVLGQLGTDACSWPLRCVWSSAGLTSTHACLSAAAQDLATMLTVTGLSGRVKALYGAFEPAHKTQGGCQCAQLWSYKDASDQTVNVRGQCVNPGGAHARAWCQYEPESCTGSKCATLASGAKLPRP